MRIGNEYCDNKEVFYIEDRDGYYWINGSEGYPKKIGYYPMLCSITNQRTRRPKDL